MKVAVCLHGLSRGSSVQADGAYLDGYSTLLQKIEGADIFIHSWDCDIEAELLEIFKPVDSFFEPQRKFEEELSFWRDTTFSKDTRISQGDLFKTLSFLYSRREAVKLKKLHEEKNQFKYDVALVTRFDVGHHNQGLNKTSHLKFDSSLGMNKIYQAYWDQTNAGASDHWFYSSSENIDMLSSLYLEIFTHLKKESEYSKLCRAGWPLSDDIDEFSGELFKEKRSENLACYTRGDNVLINNHSLYKFHLMKHGLWDKGNSIFLNKDLWDD